MAQQVAAGERIAVDSIDTFYIDKGTGHPLVLIHGGAAGASATVSWKHNVDALAARGIRVIAFDQPGYGYTGAPADYSMEYRVRHAKAFVDALGLETYTIAGNSQGAYIAARLALEDPRVDKLLLVASGTLAPPGSAEAQALAREHAESLGRFEPTMEEMWRISRGTVFNHALLTEESVRERLEMASGPRFEASQRRRGTPRPTPVTDADLRTITMPTLILWGRNDKGAAVERALLLYELFPNAELHVFSNCAHWVMWDQAEKFNRLVGDFVVGFGQESLPPEGEG